MKTPAQKLRHAEAQQRYVAKHPKRAREATERVNARWRKNQLGSIREELAGKESVFWANVSKGEANACWSWLGARKGDGYGVKIRRRGRYIMAHKAAYTLAKKDITPGMQICHSCDYPRCCNPSHLFEGTNSDNSRDAFAKGRRSGFKGASHPMVVLTEQTVCKVYADPRSSRTVATELKIAPTTIQRIRSKINWTHLTADFPHIARTKRGIAL